MPPTDVSEDTDSIEITMELAGVDPDDVRISLENNVLTIRGEKRQENEQDDERVHRIERIYGMFQRTFVLPNTVDPDRIEARYENGVLTVRIPKSERARPREIPVTASQADASQLKTRRQSQRAVGEGSETTVDQTTQSTATATTGEGQTAGNGSEQSGSSRRRGRGSR